MSEIMVFRQQKPAKSPKADKRKSDELKIITQNKIKYRENRIKIFIR